MRFPWMGQNTGNGNGNQNPGSQQQQQNGNQNQNQNQNQNGNGNQDDTLDFERTNIWDNPAPQQQQQQQQNNNNNNNNNGNNNQNGQNPEQAFQAYMDSLGLSPEVSNEALQKFRDSGDFSDIQTAFSKFGQKIYAQAMRDNVKVMEAAVSRAVEQAVSKMTNINTTNKIVERMNERLPFTSNPNVAPVAQAVLNQALKKTNNDFDKSINHVQNFFKFVHNMTSKDMNIGGGDGNPGSRRFGGNNSGGDTDWMSFMTMDGENS